MSDLKLTDPDKNQVQPKPKPTLKQDVSGKQSMQQIQKDGTKVIPNKFLINPAAKKSVEGEGPPPKKIIKKVVKVEEKVEEPGPSWPVFQFDGSQAL